MRKISALLFLVGLCVPFCARADKSPPSTKAVTLDMQIERNGQLVASPRIVVPFGTKGMIRQGDRTHSYSLTVLPTLKNDGLVKMDFSFSQDNKGSSDFTLESAEGRTASVEDTSGSTKTRITVTPTF
jgi:hypothetical protein